MGLLTLRLSSFDPSRVYWIWEDKGWVHRGTRMSCLNFVSFVLYRLRQRIVSGPYAVWLILLKWVNFIRHRVWRKWCREDGSSFRKRWMRKVTGQCRVIDDRIARSGTQRPSTIWQSSIDRRLPRKRLATMRWETECLSYHSWFDSL